MLRGSASILHSPDPESCCLPIEETAQGPSRDIAKRKGWSSDGLGLGPSPKGSGNRRKSHSKPGVTAVTTPQPRKIAIPTLAPACPLPITLAPCPHQTPALRTPFGMDHTLPSWQRVWPVLSQCSAVLPWVQNKFQPWLLLTIPNLSPQDGPTIGHTRLVQRSTEGPYPCHCPPVCPTARSSRGKDKRLHPSREGRAPGEAPARAWPPAQLYRWLQQFVTPGN